MSEFYARGITAIVVCPSVADLDSPTRLELTAGLDVSERISDINGWDVNNTPIESPKLAFRYTPTIPGPDTTSASTLVVVDDDGATDDVRDALAKGTSCYVVILRYGDIPGRRCEVWPATVTGYNDNHTLANEPARSTVGFTFPLPPEQDAVIPAA